MSYFNSLYSLSFNCAKAKNWLFYKLKNLPVGWLVFSNGAKHNVWPFTETSFYNEMSTAGIPLTITEFRANTNN